jgi:hypothetical protein
MPIPADIRNTLEWLIKIDEYNQARELALTAARYLPANHPETTDFLAMILHRSKFYEEALKYAQKTVELIPESLDARYNLARCYNSAGYPELAERHIDPVVNSRADWIDPQLDRAVYICYQGRFDEAEKILLDLQNRLPTHHESQSVVTFNLAWHMIRHGRFKEGMAALSVGRKIKVFGAETRQYPKPKIFKGLPVSGKTVLLAGEAGAGDEMINVRFAKAIRDRGGRCIWSSGQKLESLFSRVEGIDKVISSSEVPQAQYDYWAPAMDAFSLLDLDLKDLSSAPYLSPNPDFVNKWKNKIKNNGKLKVGLRWQGNPLYEQDLYRAVPFELFRKFFALPEFEFYSLQRDSGVEELLASDPVVDLSQELTSWEDTAAAISLLDVVVTSCTSIAHLAGAMGKKTLVFTPMVSYYVWALPGDSSPWYSDVKLFRQKRFHDWTQESDEVLQELKRIVK